MSNNPHSKLSPEDNLVITISSLELNSLFERAAAEQWTELTLLGPYVDSERLLSCSLKQAKRIYHCRDFWPGNLVGAISSLTNLTSLNVGGNGIGEEGARAISSLTNLTSLNVGGNNIGEEGARAISSLTNLTSLNVWDNNIGEEGARAISSLTNLTSLHVGRNNIGEEGARAISSLTNLTSLYVGDNGIGEEGARAISSLTNLTSLDVGDNGIGEKGARAISSLTNLTSLDVEGNGIGEEGARAISSLTNLTSLDVEDNNIGEEGARAISSLTNLTSLNVEGNDIGEEGARAILDAWGRRLSLHLSMLNLNENGDMSELLPVEILGNSFDPYAIISAYKRLADKTGIPLNEAKLMIVGDEAVGKTSLLRYLIDDIPCDPNERKTPGANIRERIDVESWSMGSTGISLNVWDFGGQQMMRGTHRYFLTARTLYMLVLEDRRQDDRSVHEWLKTIRNRGKSSPILIVINKSDEGKEELRLDEIGLKDVYPEIVDIVRTSCNGDEFSKESISVLRQLVGDTIASNACLKHVRDIFPKSWLDIKDQVNELASQSSILPLQEYKNLCEVSLSKEERIVDKDEQRGLLRLLHDLGTIVAYGLGRDATSVKKETTLLDPNWLTGGIYAILNNPEVRDQDGEFSRNQLAGWLDSDIYPVDRHEFILEMMQDEDIGLCFRLPGTAERYLVPEALPKSKPAFDRVWPPNSLHFRYKYSYLPPGLIPRFIVEAHRNLTPEGTRWWQGGIFVASGCDIIVSADRLASPQTVDIRVTGPVKQQRSALAVILNYLQHVHSLNRECDPDPRVPLPDKTEVDYSYNHLVKLEQEKGSTYIVYPEDGDREYLVSELLEGVRHETPENKSHKASHPELVPSKSEAFSSWRLFSVVCGVGAMILCAALYWLPLGEYRLPLAILLAVGLSVYVFVSARNPNRFYRRWLNFIIPVGPVLASGASLDLFGSAGTNVATGWLKWNNEPNPIFLIVWGFIVVSFIVADQLNSKS